MKFILLRAEPARRHFTSFGSQVSINLAEYLEELDIQTFASKQSPRGGIGLSTSTWQSVPSTIVG